MVWTHFPSRRCLRVFHYKGRYRAKTGERHIRYDSSQANYRRTGSVVRLVRLVGLGRQYELGAKKRGSREAARTCLMPGAIASWRAGGRSAAENTP